MKSLAITIAGILCLASGLSAQQIAISKATGSTPKTCWGWIKGHEEVDGGHVREIRGTVVAPNKEPIPGALIEVFAYDNDDIDKRTRVAFRVVGADGSFRFPGLFPGKYELRGSYCHGLDAGQTVVTLRPRTKRASRKSVLVKLHVSQ